MDDIKMTKPLVSILMPAFNASSFIKEAIESVQFQDYDCWELCIIDDGSTDNTFAIISKESSKDSRIKIKKLDENQGVAVARNECLKISSGQIIARLDSDDLHNVTRISKQVNYLIDNPEIDIVTCKYRWLEEDRKFLEMPNEGMNPERYLNGKDGPCCASIVARKTVYDIVGNFNTKLKTAEDADWNFRTLEHNIEWGHISEYLYTQRRHLDQLTTKQFNLRKDDHEPIRKKYLKRYIQNCILNN